MNIFWALLRAHINPRLTARLKCLRVGPKHIYAREDNFYCFIKKLQIMSSNSLP